MELFREANRCMGHRDLPGMAECPPRPLSLPAVPPPSGRKVPCEKCPLRDLHAFGANSRRRNWSSSPNSNPASLNVQAGTKHSAARHQQRPSLHGSCRAWAFRYKTLGDGRRQILNFALQADFLGLQGSVNDEMQHSVEALTDMKLCVFFPARKLWDLYRDYPTLAFRRHLACGGARSRFSTSTLLSVGRRTAMERLAYLLLAVFSAGRGGRADQEQYDSVSVHPAARRRHARHVTGPYQQGPCAGLPQPRRSAGRTGAFEMLDREALAKLCEL